ncbi:DUF3109 family protein [Marinoscillum sp. 108]|uniref:DUF3109 family protein n=1 Tax=Marinoscillum sp. 108 TaxID=2653151 RepID=UPI0012F25A97|nr:DUF3109 family protein [Marinoscillum sp. 108]VXD16476.1 conserved hypothetical protein [Marinoscillum sp. 108]
MIQIDQTLISDDIKEQFFVCDLDKCKGACCVEGDLGAPLDKDELADMEEVMEVVKPYLSAQAIAALEANGAYLLDEEGDFSTTTIDNKECAFAFYDEKKILKCSIEQAWRDGKTSIRKPISCHLYPIRVAKLHDFLALNYDRWHICSPACELGEKLSVPVYKFLKDPLIRRFGQDWYQRLCEEIESSQA